MARLIALEVWRLTCLLIGMGFSVGQLAGDYEITGVLGTGRMGSVYRVRNVMSNQVRAMKVLLADVTADEELGERLTSDIRALAKLDHPNIARFHNAMRVENQLVVLMEFIDGKTLAEVAKERAIRFADALSYVIQVLSALGYAHARGVVHRDIKPSNLMVTADGEVKLMNFGSEKLPGDPLLSQPAATERSTSYMSPEQLGGKAVEARSDIYSVGALLYELSAGRRPFEAENACAILQAQLNTVPKAPFELNPALPPAMNHIVMTALCKEPRRRFRDADAFREALENVRKRPAASMNVQLRTSPTARPLVDGARGGNSGIALRARAMWMAIGVLI